MQAAKLQQGVVESWKQKCESQLGMAAVCQSNGVFDMIPSPSYEYTCPFKISAQKNDQYYVGPSSCLVYRGGHFYDPCILPSDPCKTKGVEISLADATQPSARLKFDVRSLGNGEVLGTWPVKFTGADSSKNEVASAAAAMLEEWKTLKTLGVPWRMSKTFAREIVQGGGSHANSRGSVGNTRHKWSTVEGFANVTTDFCDAIADWWPDDWTEPVGYHATVPCKKEDTGYRVFDNVFAIDRGPSDDSVVVVKYVHSMLRDQEAYHNRFGTAGFCRSGSYASPQYMTNTMRVCTKDAVDVSYDAAVPVKPRWKDGSEKYSDEEYCAASSEDVPWTMDDSNIADAAMFSVGNAPMWRGTRIEAGGQYPDANRVREILNTNPGLRSEKTWESTCKTSRIQDTISCTSNDDCISLNPSAAKVECFRGVCILDRETGNNATCYSHADCSSSRKMCSGDGYCTHSILQVENTLDEDVEFEMHAEDCSSSDSQKLPTVSYDMYGGSPWETIPDVLSMYGMCSYRQAPLFPKFFACSFTNLLQA
jgi:hypothetical protein